MRTLHTIMLALGAGMVSFALVWLIREGPIGREDSSYQPRYADIIHRRDDTAITTDTVVEQNMVVISSGSCRFCAHPVLPQMIERAKISLNAEASRRGSLFSVIGVGVDPTPEMGWEDLARFGKFDELLIGRRWSGIGAHKFILGEYASYGGVPQVLVCSVDLSAKDRACASLHRV